MGFSLLRLDFSCPSSACCIIFSSGTVEMYTPRGVHCCIRFHAFSLFTATKVSLKYFTIDRHDSAGK